MRQHDNNKTIKNLHRLTFKLHGHFLRKDLSEHMKQLLFQ